MLHEHRTAIIEREQTDVEEAINSSNRHSKSLSRITLQKRTSSSFSSSINPVSCQGKASACCGWTLHRCSQNSSCLESICTTSEICNVYFCPKNTVSLAPSCSSSNLCHFYCGSVHSKWLEMQESQSRSFVVAKRI